MPRDKTNNNTNPLVLTSHFRGLYNRVAAAVNVDPSYVSRVARGERSSEVVEEALKKEIKKILSRTQLLDGNSDLDGDGVKPNSKKAKVAATSKNHNHNHNHRDGARRSRE